MFRVPAIVLLLFLGFNDAQGATVLARGGSNWSWYRNDISGTTCTRDPYHIVNNYHSTSPEGVPVRTIVRTQLQSFYQAGQRRLRIGLFFTYGGGQGATVVRTVPTGLPQYYVDNLNAFLSDAKAAGMAEIEIAFHPIGIPNLDYLDTNLHWKMVQQVHGAATSAGIPFLIDLANEFMPPGGEPGRQEIAADFWKLYVSKYGTKNSVGFSIPLSNPNDLQRLGIQAVYGNDFPAAIQVHNYHKVPGGSSSDYSLVNYAATQLAESGVPMNIPFIIGESLFNDTQTAQALNRYLTDHPDARDIKFLLQWPISRQGFSFPACDPTVTDITLDFQNYINEGF